MIRKQIYIDEQLELGLKALSARTGQAEAVHVRAALRTYLENHQGQEVRPGRDPLLAMIGLVDDPTGPKDTAREHDHYLYGAPKRDS